MLTVAELWRSSNPEAWAVSLNRYWDFVHPENKELELALDRLDLDRIRGLDCCGWYDFLRIEYFRWKYTAPNRYATTTRSLKQYEVEPGGLKRLHDIKQRILSINPTDIHAALTAAHEIRGLGPAGASGLLALMYPATFATVDQFVVKALRDVGELPEANALAKMNPERLTVQNGITLIGIMTRKSVANNQLFGTGVWTPRKIDQVLWTYGRKSLCKKARQTKRQRDSLACADQAQQRGG